MTTEHSTYTYEGGEQETVTLRRGAAAPHGHALLTVKNFGRDTDCYVNTAWLRDRLNDLDPRPLTADDITDEMVERARKQGSDMVGALWDAEVVEAMLTAALTEPTRPEGAEELDDPVDRSIRGCSDITSPETVRQIANGLAEQGVRVTGGN